MKVPDKIKDLELTVEKANRVMFSIVKYSNTNTEI